MVQGDIMRDGENGLLWNATSHILHISCLRQSLVNADVSRKRRRKLDTKMVKARAARLRMRDVRMAKKPFSSQYL